MENVMRTRIGKVWAQLSRLWRPALVSATVLAASTRCIEWKQPLETPETSIARYVSAVQTTSGNANAVLRVGTPPTAGLGPTVTAPLPALVLLGGTIQITATGVTPFTKVAVIVPGVNDYWELTLPAPTTSVDLLVVFSQDIPKTVFDLQLAGSFGGAFGTFQKNSVSVISVGTGDVQINLTWDSKADLDLHVVDPSGGEIYWAARTSATGGQLDLDSNAACATDGPRAENIFWASGLVAPHGDFVVRVDHWSNCTSVLTHYVVTVNVRGKPPQVFTGVFTGLGDGGGKGSGVTVSSFTY
jgi:hypothetical protein